MGNIIKMGLKEVGNSLICLTTVSIRRFFFGAVLSFIKGGEFLGGGIRYVKWLCVMELSAF